MLVKEGTSRRPKRRGGRLSLKRNETASHNCSSLPCIEPSEHSNNTSELQRWTAALFSARNAWSIRQHRLGLVNDKRLSRADADRALAMALSELAGSTDSLAKVRRGGGE